MGFLMGVYHQGGVIPTQLAIRDIIPAPATVFWWKTYSPPLWLLGNDSQIETHDLMGTPGPQMISYLEQSVPVCELPSSVFLVAPTSADFLDSYAGSDSNMGLQLAPLWSYRNHLNLDDLDFGDDGVLPTLKRVIGRRGLGVWTVRRSCK
jgi:phosphatidylinositol glycan class Z